MASSPPHAGEFRAIGDFPVLPEERHHALLNQGKIWLFGKQFLDQPTFNFGHYVSYSGGHSASFDTTNGKWDEDGPRPFQPISNEENLDEVVFVFKTQMFLLLYVHFGAFRIASLHKFEEASGNWVEFGGVETLPQHEIAAQEEKGFKQSLILVNNGEVDEGVYFVSFVDHHIRLHLLRLHPSGKASWEIVAEVGVGVDSSPGSDTISLPRLQPTMAAHLDGSVFISGGVHGCGFRWQPLQLIKVDMGGRGKSENIEILPSPDAPEPHQSKPAFSFTGSAAQAVLPSAHSWIHFAGRNASGMTGSTFNGEVWALQLLNSAHPVWALLQQRIPDPKTDGLYIFLDAQGEELYVCAKYLGVLQAHFKTT